MDGRWLGLASLVTVLCAGQASAQPAASSVSTGQWLTLSPGLSCLRRERLEELVALWLGGVPERPRARVHVRGDPRRARLIEIEVTRDGEVGVRRFDPAPAGCDEAHAAVSLVIALAVDPQALARVVPEAEPAPARAPGPRLLLYAQLGAARALLPDWSFGAALGGELGLAPWLGARADLWIEHAPDNAIEGTSGRFDATLFALDLRACAGGRVASWLALSLCSGAAAGPLHARGRDFRRSLSPTGLWLAALSGLRVRLDVGVALLLDLDVVAPARSPSFTVDLPGGRSDELVRRPSSAGLMLRFGAGLDL